MANRDELLGIAVLIGVAVLAARQKFTFSDAPVELTPEQKRFIEAQFGVDSGVSPQDSVFTSPKAGQVSLPGSGMPSLLPHPLANPGNPAVAAQNAPMQQALAPLPEGAVMQDMGSPTGLSRIQGGVPVPVPLAQADPLVTLAPATGPASVQDTVVINAPSGVMTTPALPGPLTMNPDLLAQPDVGGPGGVLVTNAPLTLLADVGDLSVSIPPSDASPQVADPQASMFPFDPFWTDVPGDAASLLLRARLRQGEDEETGGDVGGGGGGDSGGGSGDSGGGEVAAQSDNPFTSNLSVWIGRRSGDSFVPIPSGEAVRPNELISLNAQGAIGGRAVEFWVRDANTDNVVFHTVLTASIPGNVSTNLAAPLAEGTYSVHVETGHIALPFLGSVGTDSADASFRVAQEAPAAPAQPRTGFGAFLPTVGDVKGLGGMALLGLGLVAAIVLVPKLPLKREG